ELAMTSVLRDNLPAIRFDHFEMSRNFTCSLLASDPVSFFRHFRRILRRQPYWSSIVYDGEIPSPTQRRLSLTRGARRRSSSKKLSRKVTWTEPVWPAAGSGIGNTANRLPSGYRQLAAVLGPQDVHPAAGKNPPFAAAARRERAHVEAFPMRVPAAD